MTPDPESTGEKLDNGRFKKGFDKRRWLQGRPRVPKDKAESNKIVEHVIWEELSRMITNPDSREEIDALRLMVRSMIRNKQTQAVILDRILGKVKQDVDVTSGGEKIELIVKYADTNDKPTETPQ